MCDCITIKYTRGTKFIEISLEDYLNNGHNNVKLCFYNNYTNDDLNYLDFEYEKYKIICNELLNLNFNKILADDLDYQVLAEDNDLEITLYKGSQLLTFEIFRYDYNSEKRGILKIKNIVDDLFEIIKFNKKNMELI